MLITFLIVLAILVFILVLKGKEKEERRIQTQLSDFNSSVNICDSQFQATSQIIPPCNEEKFMASIDDINGSIFIKARENQLFSHSMRTYFIKYDSIIRVELIENGQKTYKKSALRTIGGAIVGGIALGGVGAIVGGLSGSSKEYTNIESIIVKIYIREVNNPVVAIKFYDKYLDQSNIYYLREAAIRLVDTISVIIDKVDQGAYMPKVKNDTMKQSEQTAPLTPYQLYMATHNAIKDSASNRINSSTSHNNTESRYNNIENEALGCVLSGDSTKALELFTASGMDINVAKEKLAFFETLKTNNTTKAD